jgi:hypothetical protein
MISKSIENLEENFNFRNFVFVFPLTAQFQRYVSCAHIHARYG